MIANLSDDAGLLQEVLLNKGSLDDTVLVEVHINVLSETRRVVVSGGLGVTERLEQRVGSKNTGLEVGDGATATVRVRQVTEDVLGRLGLSGTRLSGHNDTLGEGQVAHVAVGLVSWTEMSLESKKTNIKYTPMAKT